MGVSYLNVPALVVALIVLAVVAIALNLLSIYIISTTKALWKRNSSLLLVNLLGVHLFQGLFVFPFYAGKKVKQDFKPAQVFANGFRLSYMISFYSACLGILLIAVDRFLATYLLTKYKTVVTRKRIKLALVAFWCYVIALCLIPFINDGGVTGAFYVYEQQKEWVLFMLVVNTALPYVLVICCYVFIVFRLKRMKIYHPVATSNKNHSKHAVTQQLNSPPQLRKKDVDKHKQVTKLTFILTVLYGIFWTPSIIYYPLKANCTSCFPVDYEDSEPEQYLGFITKYLVFLDAAAAPLVYCFMHKEFQNSFTRMKSKILKRPLPEPEHPTTNETTELM